MASKNGLRLLTLSLFLLAASAHAAGPSFKKVVLVVLENTSYDEALAAPFLSALAKQGALLTNFQAETHPSQPNYVAMIAGTTAGVTDDKLVNLGGRHLGDLLEEAGKSWKVYAQGYPGGCFLGAQSGLYVRKHVPFLSFTSVQKNRQRCARITDDAGFAADLTGGRLADFSMFVPDLDNDGHDTGVSAADAWMSSYFGPLLKDPAFSKDTLLVVTFDEDDRLGGNQVYTALYGAGVAAGVENAGAYSHYSLLKTVESALGLGSLGQNDDSAAPIAGVWR